MIALNQADMAMKGHDWDMAKNAPTPELRAFLDEKARSIHKRIMENNFKLVFAPAACLLLGANGLQCG